MARAWHLMSRPQGTPTHENFALKDINLPPLGDGASGRRALELATRIAEKMG